MASRFGTLAILILSAAGGMAMEKAKKLIDQIPTEVRDYLTAGDGLAKASVIEKYPNVEQTLHDPHVRAAIVEYLGSKEPWQDEPGFTANALASLAPGASAKEAAIIRPLIKHPNPWVRLRVYEYMMAIHYPVRDQAAMVSLFQQMLVDGDEVVRVQGARWIQGLNLVQEMRPDLEQWMRMASKRKWDHGESFDLIQTMLH